MIGVNYGKWELNVENKKKQINATALEAAKVKAHVGTAIQSVAIGTCVLPLAVSIIGKILAGQKMARARCHIAGNSYFCSLSQ